LFWLTPLMGLTLSLVSFFVDSWSAIFRSQFFATTTDTLWSILFLVAPGIVAFSMVVSEF
jgi:solute carrier family 35 protein C2